MLQLLQEPQTYVSLLSLTLLEIVLGIDNIIFISILAGRLPAEQRKRARLTGLMMALVGRLLLLFSIAWLTKLSQPLFTLGEFGFSGKDLVLLGGGLFLIAKSAQEIYEKVEAPSHKHGASAPKVITFSSVILQILVIDMVFSLDSIITAVGLVSEIPIMVTAILISLGLMIVAAESIGNFVDQHPSVKVLALCFLLMIGTLLVGEAFGAHIPKGYVYFSLAFSLFVEFLNIKANTRKEKPLAPESQA
ncbi:TerC family protein [Vampirovibrio sp.]|uniref:TerC family protein n=1 Tax=Vampirovibrio sp. TaxID=2717857 RepID=UPI0035934F48